MNDREETTTPIEDSEIIFNLKDLKRKSPDELLDLASSLSIENPTSLQKHDLVFAILKRLADNGGVMIAEGVLEVLGDGYGFLRSENSNYVAGPDDIYVSPNQVRRFGLRTGDTISGPVRAPKKRRKIFCIDPSKFCQWSC